MIVSYKLVNDDGSLNGSELTCRFIDIHAIENMTRWVRRPRTLDEHLATRDDVDQYEVVPGCVTLHLLRSDFNVQADYAALKQLMLDLGEWYVQNDNR